jgi:hypothetical protein
MRLGAMTDVGPLCTSSADCSLNGDCHSGHCSCDAPWYGSRCERLEFGVVNEGTHPGAALYGWRPNVSSWGGSVVYSHESRAWHLFAAQMRIGGLAGWQSQSECIHARSDRPDGPFTLVGVAVDVECHGPVVVQEPASGEWLMFHQGDRGYLHTAQSITGPWVRAPAAPAPCGMPTAAFHPNGTLFVICGNGERILAAEGGESWRTGRWRDVPTLNWRRPTLWEDPTLYYDRHGHWHVLFHVYSLKPFAARRERYSGHAFSKDGLDWRFSPFEPFNGTVSFSGGRQQTFATRERPQLVFDPRADPNRTRPVALCSGVNPQPIGPWCDECQDGACSQCKITPGRDWTYTAYAPLALSRPRAAAARSPPSPNLPPSTVAAANAANGALAQARPPRCVFRGAGARRYDLSRWAGRTIVASAAGGGSFNVSLCGNLPTLCRDALTGEPMPPGNVFSVFGGEPAGTCWDVLARWSDLVGPDAEGNEVAAVVNDEHRADEHAPAAGVAVSLLFSHAFDAHLGCLEHNVTVDINVRCNASLPSELDPLAEGAQTAGACAWRIRIQTADESVCEALPRH